MIKYIIMCVCALGLTGCVITQKDISQAREAYPNADIYTDPEKATIYVIESNRLVRVNVTHSYFELADKLILAPIF